MISPNDDLLRSLAANLVQQVGSFFESITVAPAQPLSAFDPSTLRTSVFVVYSASGQPVGVGHIERTGKKGRQAPPQAVSALRGMPGATFRAVDAGDEGLASHLTRILRELFGPALAFEEDGRGVAAISAPAMEEASRRVPRKRGRRRRGRPPGSKNKSTAGVAAGPTAPRRRGRPPGSKNKSTAGVAAGSTAPRRRGRPPGSKNKQSGGAATAAPRRRGRPPGSKNKPKFGAVAAQGAPRRRGRPPGSKNKPKSGVVAAQGAPRRRGRPPGSKNKPRTEMAATAPPAKRRGRPRKYPV